MKKKKPSDGQEKRGGDGGEPFFSLFSRCTYFPQHNPLARDFFFFYPATPSRSRRVGVKNEKKKKPPEKKSIPRTTPSRPRKSGFFTFRTREEKKNRPARRFFFNCAPADRPYRGFRGLIRPRVGVR